MKRITKAGLARQAAAAGHTAEQLHEELSRHWPTMTLADSRGYLRGAQRRMKKVGDAPRKSAESPEEQDARIRRQYAVLSRMADRVVKAGAHKLPALVVSGPPGLGKSYTIIQRLAESGVGHDVIRGTISSPGLYLALWEQREGGVVVLDDCDSVFRDEETLNLLKAVLDSSARRIVSYRKMARWLQDLDVPPVFEFKGSVVFATNLDFEAETARGSKLAPHFAALMDRALYLSLSLRTTSDILCRLRQVWWDDGLGTSMGLTTDQAEEALHFVRDNAASFRSLSLRTMMQIAHCMMADGKNWMDDVRATKMRTL